MADKKRREQASTGFGIISLAAGAGLALFPGAGARLFGNTPEAARLSGSHVAVRALGFRDMAFGIGLLANRHKPEAGRQWLQLFSFCMAGDTLACLTALGKPGGHFFPALGGVLSAIYGGVAFASARAN